MHSLTSVDIFKGFIGAVIALLVSELIKFIGRQFSRKKERKILANYLNKIIKPGLQRYLEDLDRGIQDISTFILRGNVKYQGSYDMLPSLNSEIIKSIKFKDLYFITADFQIHIDLIDLYHVVDYLQSYPPFTAVSDFQKFCQDHLREKGYIGFDECFEHVKECSTIKQARATALDNLQLKRASLLKVIESNERLIKYIQNRGWGISKAIK